MRERAPEVMSTRRRHTDAESILAKRAQEQPAFKPRLRCSSRRRPPRLNLLIEPRTASVLRPIVRSECVCERNGRYDASALICNFKVILSTGYGPVGHDFLPRPLSLSDSRF